MLFSCINKKSAPQFYVVETTKRRHDVLGSISTRVCVKDDFDIVKDVELKLVLLF